MIKIKPELWEQGSEFHCVDFSPKVESRIVHPWGDRALLMGSGRDAFSHLFSFGCDKRGWLRLWIPSYYCQEVRESFFSSRLQVRTYSASPFDDDSPFFPEQLLSGDVILIVNYFGIGRRPRYLSQIEGHQGIEIIEDHTHDPWSSWAWSSTADWCVVSLRKTMPIPDGGVLWSPRGLELPPEISPTPIRTQASNAKFMGMFLKRRYFEGYNVCKEDYRHLLETGEKSIARGDVSGMTIGSRNLMRSMPIDEWREIRINNHVVLKQALQNVPYLQILAVNFEDNACPFCVVLLFDCPKRREYIRSQLIEQKIYPAVLWCINNTKDSRLIDFSMDYSQRMLSIHCDMRYNQEDMLRVAEAICKIGDAFV